MDERINYFAFYITLAAPVIGFLLLVGQGVMTEFYNFKKKSKPIEAMHGTIILLSSLSFICYPLYELSVPPEYNIRVDLFIIWPVLAVAIINVFVSLFVSPSTVLEKSDEE